MSCKDGGQVISRQGSTDATHRRDAAHEPRARRGRYFGVLLDLGLVREDALGGEFHQFSCPVVVPVIDVVRPPHTQRPAGVDEGRDGVLEARADDEVLVQLDRVRLDGGDEAGADPCET